MLKQHTTSSPWFQPLALVYLGTNACGCGRGAWFHRNYGAIELFQRSYLGDCSDHSTLIELLAVVAALALSQVYGKFICLLLDTTATVAIMNKRFSASSACRSIVGLLVLLLQYRDCSTLSLYLLGTQNRISDYLY